MSREQWGHGYWKGVKDALNGEIRNDIADQARWWVCNMGVSNSHKAYSRLVFPVEEFLWLCDFCGLSTEYAKRIYDFILVNEPFGCYVSGKANSPWVKDSFILPRETNANWQKKADLIASGGVKE